MMLLEDAAYAAAVAALRSYQYGNASTDLATEVADMLESSAQDVPDDCTPLHARVLRAENATLLQNIALLRRALEPFTSHNSSEPFTELRVLSQFITQARAALHSTS